MKGKGTGKGREREEKGKDKEMEEWERGGCIIMAVGGRVDAPAHMLRKSSLRLSVVCLHSVTYFAKPSAELKFSLSTDLSQQESCAIAKMTARCALYK